MSEGSTNNNKREEVRARLRQERKKELRQEKTRRTVLVGGIATVSALAIGGTTWGIIASRPEPIELGDQLTPSKVDEVGAFHIGAAGEVLENTEPNGNTRMDMFIDPQCPACGSIDRAIGERVNELLANEEIDLFVIPTAFLNETSTDGYSKRAVNALVTVAEESPEHFIQLMNTLFEEDVQPGEGVAYIPVSDADLAETAVSVGVPEVVANKFVKGHYTEWIETHTNTQLNDRPDLFPDGFSTPSIFLNLSYDENNEAVDFTRVQFQSQNPLETFNATLESVKEES